MADRTEDFSGRQYPLMAVADLTYEDLNDDQVDQIFALPGGAIILSVMVKVLTAFNGTTPVLSVGLYSESTTDPDIFIDGVDLTVVEGYSASLRAQADEGNLDEALGVVPTDGDEIAILYANAGTATAGRLQLMVEYVVPGRSQENQG